MKQLLPDTLELQQGKIIVDINNRAAGIYSDTFSQFAGAVKKLKRYGDENVFHQQAAKYFRVLKSRLDDLVKKTLEIHHSHSRYKQMESLLTEGVCYYLHEFSHRLQSM
jgi:hypothetical protein